MNNFYSAKAEQQKDKNHENKCPIRAKTNIVKLTQHGKDKSNYFYLIPMDQ